MLPYQHSPERALLLQSGGNIVDEIVVIRAADLDGSVFKAVVDALNGKRTKVVHRCPGLLRAAHRRVGDPS